MVLAVVVLARDVYRTVEVTVEKLVFDNYNLSYNSGKVLNVCVLSSSKLIKSYLKRQCIFSVALIFLSDVESIFDNGIVNINMFY